MGKVRTNPVRNLYTRAAGIPVLILLGVNAFIGLLVCIAHGGAVLMSYSMPMPQAEAEGFRRLAIFTLPIAGCVNLTTLIALLRPSLRGPVLAAQSWTLVAGTLVLWVWAASVMLAGIPPKTNFSWTPGLLTLTVGYATFLVCRHGLPARLRESTPALYAPFVAMAGTAIVDIGVFFRTIMLLVGWLGR